MEYERELIESAIEKRNKEIADNMFQSGLGRDEILKFTGVDISE